MDGTGVAIHQCEHAPSANGLSAPRRGWSSRVADTVRTAGAGVMAPVGRPALPHPPWLKTGTEPATLAQLSLARYALSLFPLTIFTADILCSLPYWVRLLISTLLMTGMLIASAQHVLGIGPA